MGNRSEWHFHGCVGFGTLIYEEGDDRGRPLLRAYVVAEKDGLRITGFDGDGESERQALETCIERDLRVRFPAARAGDPGTGATATLTECLAIFGISPTTSIKTNRGRKSKWSDPVELRRFAASYIEDGDRQGLGDRQARDVMARAAAAGLVEKQRVGRTNRYRLAPPPQADASRGVPGERERRAWVRMQDFADRLDHNWKRIAESRKDD